MALVNALKVGDSVVMSAFHWVFEIVAIEDDEAQLRTPYGALVRFPLNAMGRTSEPFEARWGNHGPIG